MFSNLVPEAEAMSRRLMTQTFKQNKADQNSYRELLHVCASKLSQVEDSIAKIGSLQVDVTKSKYLTILKKNVIITLSNRVRKFLLELKSIQRGELSNDSPSQNSKFCFLEMVWS